MYRSVYRSVAMNSGPRGNRVPQIHRRLVPRLTVARMHAALASC